MTKRFWVPRGTPLQTRGWLPDPDSSAFVATTTKARPFESISHVACLALLGEPGMGKTTVLDAAFADAVVSGRAAFLDLRKYGSTSETRDHLLSDPAISSWRESNEHLTLFIDSLDEGLIQAPTSAELILDILRGELGTARLRLRIACRSAEWPKLLSEQLRKLYPGDQYDEYELAPLRRIDAAAIAAEHISGSGEQFVADVEAHGLTALANRPVTLRFLVDMWSRGGFGSRSLVDLYEVGLKAHCEEHSSSREAARSVGSMTAGERLEVATWLAAATIFGKRIAISDRVTQSLSPAIVSVDALSSATSTAPGHVEIEASKIKDVLRHSMLFRDTGVHGVRGWQHWTYAEYLAARAVRDVSTEKLIELLFDDLHGDQRIIPQLREVAAWVAGMVPSFARVLARTEPELLLRFAASPSEDLRGELTDNLLGLPKERCLRVLWDFNTHFAVLRHRELSKRLEPYLATRDKRSTSRQLAIAIAATCEERDVVSQLRRIAIDPAEEAPIREAAIVALRRTAGPDDLLALKPIAFNEELPDDLRGYALQALWPGHLTAEEFFSLLTRLRKSQPNHFGALDTALLDIVDQLPSSEFPKALAWVGTLRADHELSVTFTSVVRKIMRRSWQQPPTPEFDVLLGRAIAQRILTYSEPLGSPDIDEPRTKDLFSSSEARRRLADLTVPCLASAGDAGLSAPIPIVRDDFEWLLTRFASRPTAEVGVWRTLLTMTFRADEDTHRSVLFDVATWSDRVRTAFSIWIEGTRLGSAEDREQRDAYRHIQRMEELRRSRSSPKHPPVRELAAECLDKFDAGDLAAWWKLNRFLTLAPDNDAFSNEMEADLTSLVGWQELTPDLEARVGHAAEAYLRRGEPHFDQWLDNDTFYPPAAAGFRALRLLEKVAPSVLSALPREVWTKWGPTALLFPDTGTSESVTAVPRLAQEHAPEAYTQAVIRRLLREDKAHGHVFLLSRVRVWNEQLCDALLGMLATVPLRAGTYAAVVDSLLQHDGRGRAAKFARSFVSDLHGDIESRAAVAAVLAQRDGRLWAEVWPTIEAAEVLAKQTLTSVAHQVPFAKTSKFATMPEAVLGRMLRWLLVRYPPSADPDFQGGAVGDQQAMIHLRDGLVTQLRSRATSDAVQELAAIVREFPNIEWLRFHLTEAEELLRQDTWHPVEPEHLYRVLRETGSHLVQDASHLMNLVLTALAGYEGELRDADLPSIEDLWDLDAPKDEAALTNAVARHLKRQLSRSIVNREVQITSEEFRTDIHVDAVATDGSRVSVVIEVKGCWNPEVLTALESQLRDRYLKQAGALRGVYCVGWFLCVRWKKDSRRTVANRNAKTAGETVEEWRRFFKAQAATASSSEVGIASVVLDAHAPTRRRRRKTSRRGSKGPKR